MRRPGGDCEDGSVRDDVEARGAATTVLECFALGTPVCGFVPAGGMADVLKFSNGSLREAFIVERSCERLSDIVLDLLGHPEKRQALVEDGRQILVNHFDAEKNCCGQLMEIYRCSMTHRL